MYRGNPRGGSGDTEDRCRGLLRGLPLVVSRRVCDPARDTLRPEGAAYAKSFRANVTAPSCLYHAARPLLPARGQSAGSGTVYTTRLTRACAVGTRVTPEWKARMEVGKWKWSLEWNSEMEMEKPSGPSWSTILTPCVHQTPTHLLTFIYPRSLSKCFNYSSPMLVSLDVPQHLSSIPFFYLFI